MKFSQEVQFLNQQENALFSGMKGESVDETAIHLVLKFAMLNTDIESIVQRINLFHTDSSFLKKFKEVLKRMKDKVT